MAHDKFLREAIRLADEAVAHGNHPFGAVLVHADQIVLTAENTCITANDITNHAETNLVRLACQQYDHDFLRQCTLYASTEPCPMCSGAIFWSGIGKVVYACSAEHLYAITGRSVLPVTCQEILSKGQPPIEVIGPFLEAEAVQSHLKYWTRNE